MSSACSKLRRIWQTQKRPPTITPTKPTASPSTGKPRRNSGGDTSSVCTNLRRICQTQGGQSTISPSIATASPAAEKPKRKHYPSVNKLFMEPNLEVLVSKVKLRSESFMFRSYSNAYTYAIDRLAKQKRFADIEEILENHKKFTEISKERHAAHLISLYGDAGMFDHAQKLFDELPDLKCERKSMSFNSLLIAALHSKLFQRVVDMFHKYPLELGFKPNDVSYRTVIRALGELGRIDEALSMVDQMKMEGLEVSLNTLNALLDGAYGRKGFAEGERIWNLMLEREENLVPDVKSYNAKLRGMSNEGMVSEAVDLFNELIKKGLKPNTSSYNYMLKLFCDKGDIEEAKKWYRKLIYSGCLPNISTFDTLVRLLCEDGDSVLALDLSNRMLGRYYVVDQGSLQLVVDCLVKDSKIDEAKKLVERGRTNIYCQYSLVMPSET